MLDKKGASLVADFFVILMGWMMTQWHRSRNQGCARLAVIIRFRVATCSSHPERSRGISVFVKVTAEIPPLR
ncbi:MAG TPA: hypothetical protein PKA21_17190, partial [Kiritimatiellia bacterium]|nr:hypothetical protein [Kiritimatiellia bacterium]